MNEHTGETIIFTDGASRGNPGPGGWGAIVVSGGSSSTNEESRVVNELGGGEARTTNNRMELKAVISGLDFVTKDSAEDQMVQLKIIIIYTDSSYVLRGATEWLAGWEAKNWITSTKTEVLNKDLWQDMSAVLRAAQSKGVKIVWKLLSGHVGIPGNERADVIATEFADNTAPKLFSGSLSAYPIKNILDISHNADTKEKRSGSKERSRSKAYSYISKVGGKIYIDKTWAECEARVKGVKGTLFKKSLSAADEKAIVADFKSR